MCQSAPGQYGDPARRHESFWPRPPANCVGKRWNLQEEQTLEAPDVPGRPMFTLQLCPKPPNGHFLSPSKCRRAQVGPFSSHTSNLSPPPRALDAGRCGIPPPTAPTAAVYPICNTWPAIRRRRPKGRSVGGGMGVWLETAALSQEPRGDGGQEERVCMNKRLHTRFRCQGSGDGSAGHAPGTPGER